MGKPAARIGDMHVCPMQTPAVVPIPHVGGPIVGPGCPTVLIGGMPAAVMGDICICVGPPATVILGSTGVLFGGKPAARLGDMTAHGGSILVGYPMVLIGEMGGGGGGGGAAGLAAAAFGGGAFSSTLDTLKDDIGANQMKDVLNREALSNAAVSGDGLAPRTDKKDLKAQFTLVDEAEKPVEGQRYEIETTDGKKYSGKTDGGGKTETVTGVTPADCNVTFFNQ